MQGNPLLFYTTSSRFLRPYMPTCPVLLSAASFTRTNKKGEVRIKPPNLPEHILVKGADCGGYVASTRWGGKYRFTLTQYLGWLHDWCPQWAATMDLVCVTSDGSYPGRYEVLKRQEFTTDMACLMFDRCRHHAWSYCPTVQGFTLDEYRAHACELADLVRDMRAYYTTPEWLKKGPYYTFRVGIGSLCRPSLSIKDILQIIRVVTDVIGYDIPLHLWGCKLRVLKNRTQLPGVISLDTEAWNGMFGPEIDARRESGLSEAEYSWQIAQPRYADKVQTALATPKQMMMQMAPSINLTPILGKQLFEVYHAVAPEIHFQPRPDLWQEQRSRAFWLAAIVEASDLEDVFVVTNGESSGADRSPVLWSRSPSFRPTSVGDVVIYRDSGEAWMVCRDGFSLLPVASSDTELSLSCGEP